MPSLTEHRPSAPAVFVVVAFVASRVAFALAGVRFDGGALQPTDPQAVQWQLLPSHLLQHDLIRSVWYLHSQPPLYNLFVGTLLHFPPGIRQPSAAAVFLALGLAMALACHLLLTEMGVNRWIAAAVAVFFTVDPATVLYENWLSWSYPTAALLTIGVFGAHRLHRRGQTRWAFLAAASFASVVLLDTTFQWPWLLAISAVLAWASRPNWRRVLAGVALPMALVAAWYVKDAALFGTPTTSSWFGMNLAQMTIYQAPPAQVASLVAGRRLTTLAETVPFARPDEYVPSIVTVRPYGVAALDDQWSDLDTPNYNYAGYLKVSPRYLSDSLSYIAAEPSTYAGNVQRSVQVWLLPADQYFEFADNYPRISGYARTFDAGLLLQPDYAGKKVGAQAELHRRPPPLSTESWSMALMTLLLVFVAPIVILRAGRADRPAAWTGLVLWLTFVYSFAVTSLTSIGENNRFRFELGPIPLVLLTLAVVMGVRAFRSRNEPTITVTA